MPVFDDAMAGLPATARGCIHAEFAGWRSVDPAQVKANIASECALSLPAFAALLAEFGAAISEGKTGVDAWDVVCRNYKLRGAEIDGSVRPLRAARVMTVETYVTLLVRTTGLPRDAAIDLLEASDGKVPPEDDVALFQATSLGRYVIWATTDALDRDIHGSVPLAARCLCVTLGLGDIAELGDPLVCVSYRPGSTVEMRRPTVADAGKYPYYRPHPDAADAFGRTAPHACRPCDYPDHDHIGQIEFVHREITGEGLVFPYRILR